MRTVCNQLEHSVFLCARAEEDLDGEDDDDDEDAEGEGEVLDGSGTGNAQNGRRAPGNRSLGLEDLVGEDLPDELEV